MLLKNLFCSHLFNYGWLQTFFIPCPFKKLTGIDCPGCGFQRSAIELLHGHLPASLSLYPATIPLILLFVISLLRLAYQSPQLDRAKKGLSILAAILITGAYLFKIGIYITQ
nr:DUF2752 domain-containing protein [uncultured Mucilaginibacter sp.]